MGIGDEIARKLKECQKEIINSANNRIVARDIIKQIKTRTRSGFGVKNGRIQKLPKLKESTRNQRQRYRQNLDPFASPGFSNVTATGQLLNSMDFEVTDDTIELFLKDNRSTSLSGGPTRIQNNELNQHLEDGSSNREPRTFFELADFEINMFERELANKIRDCIRKKLT